jgi:hypothetical protein
MQQIEPQIPADAGEEPVDREVEADGGPGELVQARDAVIEQLGDLQPGELAQDGRVLEVVGHDLEEVRDDRHLAAPRLHIVH